MTEPLPQTLCRDLPARGAIRVTGADARDFLQGQLSNDVHEVSPEHSQLTTVNTPKGRTIALMRLLEWDGALWLVLPADLQARVTAHLSKYILRARVKIEPDNDRLAQCGIAGPHAAKMLAEAGLEPPVDIDAATSQADVIVVRVPGDRFELFGSAGAIKAIRRQSPTQCESTGGDSWALGDTLARIPLLQTETSGEFLPQMLNLDELGAINFKKGCYAGQEVIARAHYRGRVKRKLTLVNRPEPAMPGETIEVSDDASAVVIQCAPRPGNDFAILAVARV